jgi:predicted DNA-binding WGR domain protein
MRRFEFVQGTSAKFWMAGVEDSTFVVVYGRLGTAGQRKDKAFPSPEAAAKELEKKIAEKLREGYHEVAAAAAAVPTGAKGAAAAAPKLELPPRFPAKAEATKESEAAAAAALDALRKQIGGRSWRVRRGAQAALQALDRVVGHVPSGALGASFEALLKERGLPLRVALALCGKLDVAAFVRALELLQGGGGAGVKVLRQQAEILDEPELALRVGALLCDRPEDGGSELSWARRWQALRPHLEGYLIGKGSNLRGFLEQIDAGGDAALAARLKRMGRAR